MADVNYPEVPFVPGSLNQPRHPYYEGRYTVPLPRWGMNREYFHANAPFHPDMVIPPDLVVADPPVNLVAPSVTTGAPVVGVGIAVTRGNWSGSPAPAITWQWQHDTAGNAFWEDIDGATANTYVPGAGDIGNRLRVVETGTNAAGSADAPSNATLAVVSSGTFSARDSEVSNRSRGRERMRGRKRS
jgi:hypothetical protein